MERKLIIPDVVKIGGIDYDVYPDVEALIQDGQVLQGQIDFIELRIGLHAPLHEVRKTETFFHECVHGMLEAAGYREQDEDLVERLGKQLYLFLRDNYFYAEEKNGRKTRNRISS